MNQRQNRHVALLLLLSLAAGLLMMSGCKPSDVPPTATSTAVSAPPTISTADTPSPSPSVETRPAWMIAYADAVLDGAFPDDPIDWPPTEMSHFRLMDLDSDGVPELLSSTLGTVNSVIVYGYTFQDDQVKFVLFNEDAAGGLPETLALYRSKETGKLQWMAHGQFRDGPGFYIRQHMFFDFSDIEHPKSQTFCSYNELLVREGAALDDIEYELLNDDGTVTSATHDEIEKRFFGVMSGYQPVIMQEPFTFTGALMKDDSEDQFDLEKLYAFLEQWDEEKPVPEREIAPENIPDLDRIGLEFYPSYTDASASLLDCSWALSDLHRIRSQVVEYYIENEYGFLDVLGLPKDLTSIKVYRLPDREDWLVISGDTVYDWPRRCLFSYRDGKLSPCPGEGPGGDYSMVNACWPEAEELKIVYVERMVFPLIEIFLYSHQDNGDFGIYRLDGRAFAQPIGGDVMGLHITVWEEARGAAVFKNIPLDGPEYFGCRYEDGHLTPVYDDANGDGSVDILLQGAFQCIADTDNGEKVIASQPVREVYLYDPETEEFEYSEKYSVRSPLADYWLEPR